MGHSKRQRVNSFYFFPHLTAGGKESYINMQYNKKKEAGSSNELFFFLKSFKKTLALRNA